ncbi:hypothetical protein FA15DRAFT_692731 [Coprinopsis marcescibilis]|uniref:CcmS related domain-containing protein n=1 Tax=Coprinopsis marcescibilis TaxID=230819 RepID=A0A5C3L2R4_COPMA|nr:hypothetical protein FA15DRAFT_692731 [Coprinopsis marcescibilis]
MAKATKLKGKAKQPEESRTTTAQPQQAKNVTSAPTRRIDNLRATHEKEEVATLVGSQDGYPHGEPPLMTRPQRQDQGQSWGEAGGGGTGGWGAAANSSWTQDGSWDMGQSQLIMEPPSAANPPNNSNLGTIPESRYSPSIRNSGPHQNQDQYGLHDYHHPNHHQEQAHGNAAAWDSNNAMIQSATSTAAASVQHMTPPREKAEAPLPMPTMETALAELKNHPPKVSSASAAAKKYESKTTAANRDSFWSKTHQVAVRDKGFFTPRPESTLPPQTPRGPGPKVLDHFAAETRAKPLHEMTSPPAWMAWAKPQAPGQGQPQGRPQAPRPPPKHRKGQSWQKWGKMASSRNVPPSDESSDEDDSEWEEDEEEWGMPQQQGRHHMQQRGRHHDPRGRGGGGGNAWDMPGGAQQRPGGHAARGGDPWGSMMDGGRGRPRSGGSGLGQAGGMAWPGVPGVSMSAIMAAAQGRSVGRGAWDLPNGKPGPAGHAHGHGHGREPAAWGGPGAGWEDEEEYDDDDEYDDETEDGWGRSAGGRGDAWGPQPGQNKHGGKDMGFGDAGAAHRNPVSGQQRSQIMNAMLQAGIEQKVGHQGQGMGAMGRPISQDAKMKPGMGQRVDSWGIPMGPPGAGDGWAALQQKKQEGPGDWGGWGSGPGRNEDAWGMGPSGQPSKGKGKKQDVGGGDWGGRGANEDTWGMPTGQQGKDKRQEDDWAGWGNANDDGWGRPAGQQQEGKIKKQGKTQANDPWAVPPGENPKKKQKKEGGGILKWTRRNSKKKKEEKKADLGAWGAPGDGWGDPKEPPDAKANVWGALDDGWGGNKQAKAGNKGGLGDWGEDNWGLPSAAMDVDKPKGKGAAHDEWRGGDGQDSWGMPIAGDQKAKKKRESQGAWGGWDGKDDGWGESGDGMGGKGDASWAAWGDGGGEHDKKAKQKHDTSAAWGDLSGQGGGWGDEDKENAHRVRFAAANGSAMWESQAGSSLRNASKTMLQASHGLGGSLQNLLQPNPMAQSNIKFLESGGKALEQVHKAFFNVNRPTRERLHWMFPPENDIRVLEALTAVQQSAPGVGTYGVQKFLKTRERGAIFINASFRFAEHPKQPVFDWLGFDTLQQTMDKTLQESAAFYDPALLVIVFVYLPSPSGNSVAIWRRKIQVPANVRTMYHKDIGLVKMGLRPESEYVVYVEEYPQEQRHSHRRRPASKVVTVPIATAAHKPNVITKLPPQPPPPPAPPPPPPGPTPVRKATAVRVTQGSIAAQAAAKAKAKAGVPAAKKKRKWWNLFG